MQEGRIMHLKAGNKDFGGDKYILSFSHLYRNKSQEKSLALEISGYKSNFVRSGRLLSEP